MLLARFKLWGMHVRFDLCGKGCWSINGLVSMTYIILLMVFSLIDYLVQCVFLVPLEDSHIHARLHDTRNTRKRYETMPKCSLQSMCS